MANYQLSIINYQLNVVCRFKRNEESPASTLPAGLFTHFGSRLDSELKTTIHHEPFTIHHQIGPCPMQLVVPSAVRKAVSAATATFTTSSIIRFFFILS